MVVTRFAPSPSGLLHLGHAYSALFAARAARSRGGRFLLRIEDIDGGRCRPEFEEAIFEDLAWLGLDWEEPVPRQSDRAAAYRAALDRLQAMGLLYPCFCTRKEIQAEIAGAANAPHGPDGPLYPGTCRALPAEARAVRMAAGETHALRLDTVAALARTGRLFWSEGDETLAADPAALGDVVLARKDAQVAYHLAVTLDDAAQGVTLVTRGKDLFHATHVHRLLQALLDLPVPRWRHHNLIADDQGQRLAKRHDALSIRTLRRQGHGRAEVRAMAGFGGRGEMSD